MKAVILDPVFGSSIDGDAQDLHRSTLMLGNGETLLHRQIRILHECKIKDFVISTGYNDEQINKAEIQANFSDAKFTFVNNPKYNCFIKGLGKLFAIIVPNQTFLFPVQNQGTASLHRFSHTTYRTHQPGTETHQLL